MASHTRTPPGEREEQRRISAQTLLIASVASASAALLVSQLWIAGTWIAAALTPVIVALVSEALHTPTERIARAMTVDRTAVEAPPEEYEPRAEREDRPFPPAPEPGPARAGPGPLGAEPGPVHVYGRPTRASRRKQGLAVGVVAVTAIVAFVVAFGGITLTEVIGGRSITSGDRSTTFLGGHRDRTNDSEEKQDTEQREQAPADTNTTPETTTEETPAPAQETTPQETPPSATVPQETPVPQTTTPTTPTVPAQP